MKGDVVHGPSKFNFLLMDLCYRCRDLIRPRREILEEARIEAGSFILDYGCGTGSYLRDVLRMVGPEGKLYALDVDPYAVERARTIGKKLDAENLITIRSDCATQLDEGSIDVVLLYDVFHHLSDPSGVLGELHRILKSGGFLSFSDHHLSDNEIMDGVSQHKGFELSVKGKKTYLFMKV